MSQLSNVLSARRNYAILSLIQITLGVIATANLSWLPPQYIGPAMLAVSLMTAWVQWFREYLGIAGQPRQEP